MGLGCLGLVESLCFRVDDLGRVILALVWAVVPV